MHRPYRSRGFLFLALVLGYAVPVHAQGQVDTATAIAAMREFTEACTEERPQLWAQPLCGPMVFVHPGTRFAIANEPPPGTTFTQTAGVYLGKLPDSIPTANTSFPWAGTRWSMALLPLPEDRLARLGLLAHESFHRIQPILELGGSDPLNAHLDTRDGRFWLRLELHALAEALRSDGDAARRAARDALLFRAYRHQLFPGADTLEAALERHEGLAEYSGVKFALAVTGESVSRVADQITEYEKTPTFVRSLGYGTGPALGLLLDRYTPGWRLHVAERGIATQLAQALQFHVPDDLAAAAEAHAGAYGAGAVALEEDAREETRRRRVAEYRARLIEGPVIVFQQGQLMRRFNPNELIPLGDAGTIYPTGVFGAEWGKLEVTAGGALVSLDFTAVRVPAPPDTAGVPTRGDGWTLQLEPGWSVQPGERPGDLIVVQTQESQSPAPR